MLACPNHFRGPRPFSSDMLISFERLSLGPRDIYRSNYFQMFALEYSVACALGGPRSRYSMLFGTSWYIIILENGPDHSRMVPL